MIHYTYMHSGNPRLRVKEISANIKAAVTSKKIGMVEALLKQWKGLVMSTTNALSDPDVMIKGVTLIDLKDLFTFTKKILIKKLCFLEQSSKIWCEFYLG